MADYATEEEQVEAIRRWWRENGRSVIVGVLIGLAALGGWRGWDWYQTEQGLAASRHYEQLMQQIGNGDRAVLLEHARTLRQEYAGTAYAPLGALAAAKAQVSAGEPGKAVEWLQWALDNADDAHLQHIARARLARVVAAEGDAERALSLLDSDVPASYEALYAELRGDVLADQGRTGAAVEAYEQALNASVPPSDRGFLERKLNRLQPSQEAERSGNAQQTGAASS